jgi:hypothetical protein
MGDTRGASAHENDHPGGASREESFGCFFAAATDGLEPYAWQRQVALDGLPDVLPIPTGLGKTEGAVLAWAWRRLVKCEQWGTKRTELDRWIDAQPRGGDGRGRGE